MTTQDMELELQTDELLRQTGNLGKKAGCYTTVQMQRQDRLHLSNMPLEQIDSGVLQTTICPKCVLPEEINAWVRYAGLSRREADIIKLRMSRCTWEYIAWEFNYSEATARRVCSRAVIKLKRTAPVDVVAMLAEVFKLTISEIIYLIKKI